MHESRCFRASQGRLGCISCHDPHRLPAARGEGRLLPGALPGVPRRSGLPPAGAGPAGAEPRRRLRRLPHAAPAQRSDVIHAATTNHRIPRQRGRGRSAPDRYRRVRGHGERPVVIFHRDLMDERERAAAERDIGVALCRDGPAGCGDGLAAARGGAGGAAGRRGRLGGQGVRAGPARPARRGDWRPSDGPGPGTGPGVRAGRRGVPRRPGGRRDDAIAYWRRAIAISPWRSDYHAELAALCFHGRDWSRPPTAVPRGPPPESRRPRDQEAARPVRPPSARTPRPPAGNSRPSWDSIPPTAKS